MRKNRGRVTHPSQHLPERIIADLLDLPDEHGLGDAIGRRVQHLQPEVAKLVLGQALGITVLLIQQIRDRSMTGADVIRDVRNGLTTDLVSGSLPTTGGDRP